MAGNKAYDVGDKMAYKVGVGTKSGDPVRVGGFNGVAITDAGAVNEWGYPSSDNDIASGNETDYASIDQTGIWKLPVTITTTDKDQGATVYAIANANAAIKKVTLTDVASGNKVWGHLHKGAKVGASVMCYVKVQKESE